MTNKKGQVVRVKGGPWEGFQGEVTTQDGRFLHITGDEASQARWKRKGVHLHEGQVEVLEEDRKGPAVPLDVPSVPPPPAPDPREEERSGVAGPVEEANGQLRFPGFSPPPRKDRDPSKATRARWDLMPALAEEEVVAVLTQSTQVYPPDNWREIPEAEFYPLMYAAARRHMSAHRRGVDVDPDSGRHPLAHAALCLLFILERELETDRAAAEAMGLADMVETAGRESAQAATEALEARVSKLEGSLRPLVQEEVRKELQEFQAMVEKLLTKD